MDSPRTTSDDVLESQLYTLLAKHDQIETLVPNIASLVPKLVSELGGFKQNTSARADISSFIFFSELAFTVECLKKGSKGRMMGVPLPGGGTAYGTLYYDDLSDLVGVCELQVVTTILALNINFVHSGKTFATFIGVYGGVSAANGIFSGGGRWSDVSEVK